MHLRFIPTSFLVVALAGAAVAVEAQRRVPDAESQPEPERTAQPRPADRPAERPQERQAQPRPPAPPAPPVQRPRHGAAVHGEVVFIGGYFYDPFFGPYPWWPRPPYPRPYFPHYDMRAFLRLDVEPRNASVYVDGYYAGIVDDFDGIMQSLPLPPGGHEITLYLEDFRALHRSLYLRPGSRLRLQETLQPRGAGEASELPPVAYAVPEPPAGTYSVPHTPNPRPQADSSPQPTPPARSFGSLDLRVEPREAEVTVDGRRWISSDDGHFVIDLPSGTHTVEVFHAGFPTYRRQVVVPDGQSTSLNVSLMGQ
jgi:hypothetical protein